jgi:hypothetical protein
MISLLTNGVEVKMGLPAANEGKTTDAEDYDPYPSAGAPKQSRIPRSYHDDCAVI